jgi:transcription elongation factor SPT6
VHSTRELPSCLTIAATQIAEGFIVDEEEEDEEARVERKRERKKRKREQREREDEGLDEEDLDLIGFGRPVEDATESKFKRLKRGPREGRDRHQRKDVEDIFGESDEDEGAGDYRRSGRIDRRGLPGEFDGFIEEDVLDEEQQRMQEDKDVARPTTGPVSFANADTTGLDEAALEDLQLAFGDGTDYDFAIDAEMAAEEQEAQEDKHLDLKDVFEPSQLAERMLTEEDNVIRHTDEPERFQLARKPYRHVTLTDEQSREEATWISQLMLPKRGNLWKRPELHEPFRRAVGRVLEFMVSEDYEVPFIFHNRKDYLIHANKTPRGEKDAKGDMQYEIEAVKLLFQTDLWEISELDLKFRGLIDKRNSLQTTYDDLLSNSVARDGIFEAMLPTAKTMEELQDVQDYLYFQYTSQLKDLAALNGVNDLGLPRKTTISHAMAERIRNGNLYSLVRAFGISADAFAQNASNPGVRKYTEDPNERPDDLADRTLDEDFPTGSQALKAAKYMFIEELFTSPRLRRVMRQKFYQVGVIDCYRTEKGLRKIDEQHPYYEFKYLRNQEFAAIARQPDLYLKMLKAEEEGLVEVKVRLQNFDAIREQLFKQIESDNFSEVADAWNRERREVLETAIGKLTALMGRLVKENLKIECESIIAQDCRDEFSRRLDQAPYTPKGHKKGTVPRVLALSNGNGVFGRDAICWVWVAEDGRAVENGKWSDLAPGDKERGLPDGKDVEAFASIINRKAPPDVIGISGFSPETRKLYNNLNTIIRERDLRGSEFQDEDGNPTRELLEVVIVNDEIARLYQTSERAKVDHPSFAPLTNYCVALARYLQDPLLEYAALGRDLVSISFSPAQYLLPQDRVLRQLETVLVDIVNLVGVNLNDAVQDMSIANLLPYVSGLGPRKAAYMLKIINLSGGQVTSRADLLGFSWDHAALGPTCWNNGASTFYVEYHSAEKGMEYLDNTRIHPEDYDIARKMAADALEVDEEDVQVEDDENGKGAIVRRLVKEGAQDRVNDLILEEYAEQLERKLSQRKRATLENIRSELIDPYEELRNPFITQLASEDIFTMFTGETRDSLDRGMVVPMAIKRITDDHIDGKLDCGIDAFVGESDLTDRYDVSVKSLYSVHQTVQAKILSIDRKHFTATVSLREDEVKRPQRKFHDRQYDEWDEREEAADKKLLEEKTNVGGRATRVIKHPLFRAFNSAQAEEYLGSQNRGDVIIRPSSKGVDHLAVTWKVSDGIFQHIDVLEMDKENEFALGKTLKIAGKYTYSDLDELIVLHVKAMAKKVEEMMLHEKFQNGSKADTGMYPTQKPDSTK